MARPIFQHELTDPDFSWLLSTFQENHPEYVLSDSPGAAVVFIRLTEEELHNTLLPMPSLNEPDDLKDSE